jgi:hypothetical protein
MGKNSQKFRYVMLVLTTTLWMAHVWG